MTRILLQDFETGLYLDLAGAWTSSPESARDFPNCVKATEFKIQRRLSHAFVVVLPETTQAAVRAAPANRTITLARELRCPHPIARASNVFE